MKKAFLLVAVLMGYVFVLSGQTVDLEVWMNDQKIGEIHTSKTVKGKKTHATLSSQVAVNMLVAVKVESSINSDYEDGKLVRSAAARVSNIRSENKKSQVDWNGSQYIVSKGDGDPTSQTGPATYCVLDLYFTEPKNITRAFSELGGIYMPVTPLQNHRYQLTINDSKKDIFVYDNAGKLVQVETIIAMNKVIFKVK